MVAVFNTPFWPKTDDAYMQLFRTMAAYVRPDNSWVLPTFQQGHDFLDIPHFYNGALVVSGPGVVWRDVSITKLTSNPELFLKDFSFRMRETNQYATNQLDYPERYVGAFPTMFIADYHDGRGMVCGTVFLKPEAAEWHDLSKSVLGNPEIVPIEGYPARFIGTQKFAENVPGDRFAGGFPTCFHADKIGDVVCGALLLNHSAATFHWFETYPVFDESETCAHPLEWSADTFKK